jgi:hypothetical protein
MTWSSMPGTAPAAVVVTDCPVCSSAGSARRGVCDICGARSESAVGNHAADTQRFPA